ncbi:hypothetical protein EER27_04750 [Lysobacter psychrotolerans]|uniref:Uncharacterized protein n=1 Tax=Montanilutibacter psychrotolerans TaxID=1327343 RepID=A0A3M8T083_9GAMM|nr:hypothetical protein EER27_04750 [Lysobacter psychrotolerans]
MRIRAAGCAVMPLAGLLIAGLPLTGVDRFAFEPRVLRVRARPSTPTQCGQSMQSLLVMNRRVVVSGIFLEA